MVGFLKEKGDELKELQKEDLKQITGGIGFGTGLLIAGGVIFLIGVIDGYTRPLRCNS